MKIKLIVVLAAFITLATAGVSMAADGNPKVEMETSKGKFVIELFQIGRAS